MSYLRIVDTLRESVNLLLNEWKLLGSIVIGPVLAITAVSLLARVATQKAAGTAVTILMFAVLTFSSVKLAVFCHRFILLGVKPSSFIQGCKWQLRDTWFALYGIGIYLFAWFFIFVAAVSATALSPFLALLPNWLVSLVLALGMIAMWLFYSYLMGRLSLILPVTAIDRRPANEGMNWAWSQSEGNEWPLMFLLGVNPSIGSMLLKSITGTMIKHANDSSAYFAAPIYGLAWGLYFLSTVFQVAVLSLCLKRLSTEEDPVSGTIP